MISIDEKSTIKTIENYLSEYRSIFNKRSFHIFILLVTAILSTQEVRSIKFLYDNFLKKYWHKVLNSFYYFLSYTNFSIESLMFATVKIAISLIPEELKSTITIFLIIDDTLQAKFGNKFDCYGKLFDHTKHDGTSFLNGHCFVSLVISIPILFCGKIKYLTLPVGYKLYDKSETKLKIAGKMIQNIMPLLLDVQVIVLCDSWYTKTPFLNMLKYYSNLSIIGAVRSDTVMYDLCPEPTGKRGRPRKKGLKFNIRDFDYTKENDYYIATKKVLTNLFNEPVMVIVTTTDVEKFSSVRVYICSIEPSDILSFKNYIVDESDADKQKTNLIPFFTYKFRWNIEVFFYQHKFFWSFGNYMVRNKRAIENYTNLLAIAYSFVVVLPFIHKSFSKYKFQSPQEIKNAISYQISKELILSTFVQKIQKSKINEEILETINSLIYLDEVS
ncbi:transposase [Clostridium sp. PL3]|uniref:Transposase n=1 Tax=Clostridium thailandense TaxID=2794346 RepID=A0A949TVR9_9CLOT|nr:transposase [Clostridium thailandense]MBV7271873.1 transposase [Clostridium thailandense]